MAVPVQALSRVLWAKTIGQQKLLARGGQAWDLLHIEKLVKFMVKRRKMSLLFRQSTTCAALACAGFLLGASLYASILPPDRTGGPTPAWARANVGVEGGIPNSSNMTVYATVPAGASSSTIQAALNACPSNQVVQLSAGNYPNLSGIRIPNGVVLRGAGMTSTVLTFTSGGIGAGGSDFAHLLRVGTYGAPPGYGIANWTAGYAQGGSNLTFSTTSGLSVGNIVYLDQINDPFYVSYAGYEGPRIGGRDQNHEQMQMCEVQNVNGNTVTVWPPIAMPNWSGALSPAASWMAGSSWVRKAGVENLTIDGSVSGGIGANQGNIAFSSARDCWVQNVKSLNGYRCHIAFEYGGFRNEARHCYFYGTQHAAQESYGIITIVCSSCLVEDNIFEKVASPILPQDCSSMNVSAYNYTTNNYYTGGSGYLMASIDDHANHICMNLNEGNYGNGFAGDFIWGSGSHNVAFRNRYTGWEPYQYSGGPTLYSLWCIYIGITNRSCSSVGNILGTAGRFTTYEATSHGQNAIYNIGLENTGYGKGWGNDPVTKATFFRHMDYDTVNNGIVYNPTNADVNLPASLLYLNGAKPAFFGSLPWPPYNPSNTTAAAISPTNIPAGYRYVFGVDPPSGPQNLPPIAVLNSYTNGVSTSTVFTNQPVSFSSAGSSDPEGVSLSFSWDFGDGGTSVLANPTHSFATNGSFNVQLRVSDGVNTTVSSKTITVKLVGVNLPPNATASASPVSGVAPLSVNFSGSGSDPEGTPLSFSWSFGDGGTANAANPTHIFTNPGLYTNRLTVSDGTNSVTATPVIVTAGAPGFGLVAAYGFEEASGTTVGDASGNNNVGTIAGATWTANGRFGKALVFDGSTSIVTINDAASLHLGSSLTLEAWVNPTALASWKNLIYKSQGSGQFSYVLQGCSTSNQVPSLAMNIASSNLSATSPLPLNTWSHVAATYDGTMARFFINSVQVASQTQTGTITCDGNPLTIGGNSFYGENWAGLIDEVRIYNRALSQAEVHSDMNVPVAGSVNRPLPPTNPVARTP